MSASVQLIDEAANVIGAMWRTGSHVEQVAFAAAEFDEQQGRFIGGEVLVPSPKEFLHQSSFHLDLSDGFRSELLAWARAKDAALIEFHTHVHPSQAEFSYTDLRGFDEWVPHVRWRLSGVAYAAVVLARGSFDGLAWIEPGGPEQIETMKISSEEFVPTGLTLLSEEVDG